MPFGPSTYEPFTCASCGERQRVYVGDPEDVTVPDVDAVRCWKCGAVEQVCDEHVAAVQGGHLNVADGEPL